MGAFPGVCTGTAMLGQQSWLGVYKRQRQLYSAETQASLTRMQGVDNISANFIPKTWPGMD